MIPWSDSRNDDCRHTFDSANDFEGYDHTVLSASPTPLSYIGKQSPDGDVIQLAWEVGDEQGRTPEHGDRYFLPVKLSAIFR